MSNNTNCVCEEKLHVMTNKIWRHTPKIQQKQKIKLYLSHTLGLRV